MSTMPLFASEWVSKFLTHIGRLQQILLPKMWNFLTVKKRTFCPKKLREKWHFMKCCVVFLWPQQAVGCGFVVAVCCCHWHDWLQSEEYIVNVISVVSCWSWWQSWSTCSCLVFLLTTHTYDPVCQLTLHDVCANLLTGCDPIDFSWMLIKLRWCGAHQLVCSPNCLAALLHSRRRGSFGQLCAGPWCLHR